MNNGDFNHIPVLLRETVEGLNIRPDGVYVDGTAGGGGHSVAIAKRLNGGRLIALDRDPDAVRAASRRLEPYPWAQVVHARFSSVKDVLDKLGIPAVDGMLLDLGVSSHQLDTPERGFSYHAEDAPLDMRMSREGMTAADLVNTLSAEELADIFFRYGEEKHAFRIAAAVVRRREKEPVMTVGALARIVAESVPASARREKNPARKTFQALRIAVNGEFDELETGLRDGFDLLKPGGRLAVITFHSAEDRIVKQFFASLFKGCVCPPDFPVCVCGRRPRAAAVTKKPAEPTPEEVAQNKRSRSAKLRIAEKLS